MSASAALSGAGSGAALGTAILPGWGTAAGAVVGGLVGAFSGNGDDATKYSQDAVDAINNIANAPDLQKPILIQQYQDAGVLTPVMLQQLNLNSDKATTLTENQGDIQQQKAALTALQQLSQNGMSAQDQAETNQLRNSVAADTNAKIQQTLQAAAQRGQNSSGNTLAAELSAIQGGQQTQSSSADQIAASAANARAQALQNYSNLATGIRGQDFNTQQYNTTNDIQRQQFLDQNAIARQNANVAATNNANLYNIQRAQGVSDANTSAQNQELQRQVAAQQQQWSDNNAKATELANAYSGYGQVAQSANNAAAQNWGTTVNGFTQLAGALKTPASTGNTYNVGLGANNSNMGIVPPTAGQTDLNNNVPTGTS